MCSLGDFMQRPSRVATGSWTAPASLPGRALVRYQSSLNSRGGDCCWPPADTSVGHKRGLSLATSGYFEVATAIALFAHQFGRKPTACGLRHDMLRTTVHGVIKGTLAEDAAR